MVKKTVFGIFATRQQSENTVHSLQQAGFGTNDISALLPDQGGSRDFAHEQHTKAPRAHSWVLAQAEQWVAPWGC